MSLARTLLGRIAASSALLANAARASWSETLDTPSDPRQQLSSRSRISGRITRSCTVSELAGVVEGDREGARATALPMTVAQEGMHELHD
jgi:hypothetical protein